MTKFELCGRHAIYMISLSRMPETFFGTPLNLPDILEALSHIWKLILFKSTLHFLIVLVSRWAKPIPAFSSPLTGTVYISLSDRTPSFVTYWMDGNHELISIGNIWCCISRHTRYFSVIYFLNDPEWHFWAKSLMKSFWLLVLVYAVLYFHFDFEFNHAFSAGLCLLIKFTILTKFESSSLSPLKANLG